jgi:DNA-binding transcriptional regulator GbsR (MarR family)
MEGFFCLSNTVQKIKRQAGIKYFHKLGDVVVYYSTDKRFWSEFKKTTPNSIIRSITTHKKKSK